MRTRNEDVVVVTRGRDDSGTRGTHPLVRLSGLALAGLLLTTAAACSGSDDGAAPGPDQPGDPTTSATAAPASSLPKGVTPAPIPTKVANDPGDRKNVVLTTCEAAEGGWQASGTATNPTKSAVEFRVTVFFTTTSATTIDSARTDVEVKPGETVKWTAKKEFAAPKEMLCVLRGVAAKN